MKKELSRIVPKSPQYTGNIPHIIGIGASAGGLEPIENFLANVPVASGMAFIVVQHLGPTYKGILVELLQRVTPMTILQAGNRMKVKPDTVYVIPPNKDLSIIDGTLYLLDPKEPRGMHLPIDFFFRVLAEDQHERAAGVILSGMGSDGTLGLRSIKENGGLTLVQDPASAKFPSMPQSVIDAGVADIVDAVNELPKKIVEYLRLAHVKENVVNIAKTFPPNTLDEIIALLRHRSGNDFSLYKKNTLLRRIERRMGIHQLLTLDAYSTYLKENPQELDLLFKELLIGVTSFFRDPTVWEQLKREVIPALLAAHPQGKSLRAWVVPCSTGEEAYTLAMVFREVLEEVRPSGRFTLRIFATDLDQDAVAKARQGVYPPNIVDNVMPERLDRFFIREQNNYRINKEIREMVTFAPQNVLTDPPFTKLDILCCRNLLIYLGPQLQAKLLPLFHYAIGPNGILVLGNAETIGTFTGLFEPINSRARLYQRVNHQLQRTAVEFPTKFARVEQNIKEQKVVSTIDNLQSQADQVLLQNFSPSAVLVNRDGDIVYISGRTGKYLEPAAGKANWNIYAMARDGLRHELAGALKKVVREQGHMALTGLQVQAPGSEPQTVNVTLQLLDKPPGLRGMIMIVFTDVATPPPKKIGDSGTLDATQVDALESANEEIQTLREEMQASHEELTSANEELQSTNEELQSTNEELTTSKEEMQSLNEELQTVNSELQSKVDDLSTVSNDMKNLLNSTDIATVFLDNDLNVRRFTTQATRIFKLIAGDVGRSLSDIAHDLQYPQLQEDIKEVLHTLNFRESQVATNDGRWYKVRIMPYRTIENVIHGIVLTFSDITAAKELEAKLRERIEGIPDKKITNTP
jgi:two-component system CheB/CheR fusion protein